jgi:hypothetical protein
MNSSTEVLLLLSTMAGMLAAFALGVWAGRGRRSEPAHPPIADPSPDIAHFIQKLRLPRNIDNPDNLAAWYFNLREAAPLAARLHHAVEQSLNDAIAAVHDVINTPGLDDRYELFAAALLPVYEACAAWTAGAGRTAFIEEPVRHFQREPAKAERREMTDPVYDETDRSTPPVDRAELFRRVQEAARDTAREVPAAANPVEPGGATARLMRDNARAMDSSQLSKRLTQILKTPENEADQVVPMPPEQRNLLPLQLIREQSETVSRLKRRPPDSPEEAAERRAAQVVGRAREWYGRPDLTIEEVHVACREFGMSFEGDFIRIELEKPIADETFV